MGLVKNDAGRRALDRRLDAAHRESLQGVLTEVQAHEPHRSGELAGSYDLAVRGDHGGVYSNSEYAGPIERGAWSKGRGPHISRARANHVLRNAGNRWLDRMRTALR